MRFHIFQKTQTLFSRGGKRPLGHQGEAPRRAGVPGARFKIAPERGGVAPHSKWERRYNRGITDGGRHVDATRVWRREREKSLLTSVSSALQPLRPPTKWRVGRCTSGVPRLKYVNKLNCGFENYLRAFVAPDSSGAPGVIGPPDQTAPLRFVANIGRSEALTLRCDANFPAFDNPEERGDVGCLLPLGPLFLGGGPV